MTSAMALFWSVSAFVVQASDQTNLFRLTLRRESFLGDSTANKGSMYVGLVTMGSPSQQFEVVFDTGSGQVILPLSSCQSSSCMEHYQFEPHESGTVKNCTWPDGVLRPGIAVTMSTDLGDGQVIGRLMEDTLCVHGDTGVCTEVSFIAATSMTPVPFEKLPCDGVVGLGLAGLTLDPQFSLLNRWSSQVVKREFAMYFANEWGEVTVGGHDPARFSSPLVWAPVVNPESGFWQIGITAVRVGSQTLKRCQDGTCRGLVDTAASRLGAHTDLLTELKSLVADPGRVCRGEPRQLHIDTAGLTLTVEPADYLGVSCDPAMTALDIEGSEGVIVLGGPLLRRYYTVFDWEAHRIGFGVAAPELQLTLADLPPSLPRALSSSPDVIVAEQLDNFSQHVQRFCLFQCLVLLLLCAARHASLKTHFRSQDAVSTIVTLSEWPGDEECVICLGSCVECDHELQSGDTVPPSWCRLRCGHRFHEQCIQMWLRRVAQCPVCRRDMDSTQRRLKRPSIWSWVWRYIV